MSNDKQRGTADRVTFYVCTTCRDMGAPDPGRDERPGARLARNVAAALAREGETDDIDFVPVECLGVCKRPCTISFMARGRWIYLIGDIEPDAPIEPILAGLRRYAQSPDGIVPWRERPEAFRKGLVGRIPPLPVSPDNEDQTTKEGIA